MTDLIREDASGSKVAFCPKPSGGFLRIPIAMGYMSEDGRLSLHADVLPQNLRLGSQHHDIMWFEWYDATFALEAILPDKWVRVVVPTTVQLPGETEPLSVQPGEYWAHDLLSILSGLI